MSAPGFEGLLLDLGGQLHAVRHLGRLLLHLSLRHCPGFHSNPPPHQIAPVERGEPGSETVGGSERSLYLKLNISLLLNIDNMTNIKIFKKIGM